VRLAGNLEIIDDDGVVVEIIGIEFPVSPTSGTTSSAKHVKACSNSSRHKGTPSQVLHSGPGIFQKTLCH